jgi:hypothetical protein
LEGGEDIDSVLLLGMGCASIDADLPVRRES